MRKKFFTYILTNKTHSVLYTGVTGCPKRRMVQHKEKANESFTKRYNVDRLVYFEVFDDPRDAIAREKQIKAGSRAKKIQLIRGMNPCWNDLTEGL
jgi:putative endonuclease